MVLDIFADKKQRFHIVQLAMFNADVLASVQREAETNANGVCKTLIDQSGERNVAAAPPAPSTINQSLFFAMAYLSLVWLRESLSDEEVEAALASEKMTSVWSGVSLSGPRDLSLDTQKLRLIRNALSHGNVEIDRDFVFSFWDQNKRGRNKEGSATFLKMKSDSVGRLATQFYYAVSDVIYS